MSRRARTVTLVGYYGFNNLGDDLLLSTLMSCLSPMQPEIQVQVLSHNPSLTLKQYPHAHTFHRMRPTALIQALRRSRWLILGGGGLFQDETSLSSVVYYAGLVILARLLGNKVLWWAQGIGPLKRPLAQWLTGCALRLSQCVMVRDVQSQHWVQQLAASKTVHRVEDPVWLLQPTAGEPPGPTKGVGVSLRDWPHLTEAGLEKLAQWLEDRYSGNTPVVLLSFQDSQDRPVLERFRQYLKTDRPVHWGNCSIDGITTTIQALDVVIAMRFHALILGALCHKPLLAISYDPKVSQLASTLNVSVVDVFRLASQDSITMPVPPDETIVERLRAASGLNRQILQTLPL